MEDSQTHSAKRRQAEAEEEKRKDRRHEHEHLLPRKDKALRPTDMLVDTALRKVKIPPEEEEKEDVKVKVEPVEDDLAAVGMEAMDDVPVPLILSVSGGDADPPAGTGVVKSTTASVNQNDEVVELKAKVALLEAQVQSAQPVLDEILGQFVKSWDPVTKHLHIDVLSFNGSLKENWILSQFPGLTHLEVERIEAERPYRKLQVPDLFKDLKTLKFVWEVVDGAARHLYTLLPVCQNLESITPPRLKGSEEINRLFACLREHVRSKKSRLKEIDLHLITDRIWATPFSEVSKEFRRLFKACAVKGVKICYPCSKWTVGDYDSRDQVLLGRCIKSLEMIGSSSCDHLLLPNLEQLESLTLNSLAFWIEELHQRLTVNGKNCPEKWSRLSKLDVNLGKHKSLAAPLKKYVAFLSKFLMEQSPNLEELRVENNPRGNAAVILNPSLLCRLPLRKLTLTLSNISSDSNFLEKTWEVLPFLEELTIQVCFDSNLSKDIGWFTSENSTFLRLTSLRKLWLQPLYGILGDKLNPFLRNVLSKMQLTHLDISAERDSLPLQDNLVPRAGIESLIKGPGGQSLQELTVDGRHMFSRNYETA